MRKQSQSLISLQKPINNLSKVLLNVHNSGKYQQIKLKWGIPHTNKRCAVGAVLSELYGYDPAYTDENTGAEYICKLANEFGELNINLIESLNDETNMNFGQIAEALEENWNKEVNNFIEE